MVNSKFGLMSRVKGGDVVADRPAGGTSEDRKRDRQAQKLQKEALELLFSNQAVQDRLAGRTDKVRAHLRTLRLDVRAQRDLQTNKLYLFNGYVGKFDAQFTCEFVRAGHDTFCVDYAQGKGAMTGTNDGKTITITFWKDHNGVTKIKK